MFVNKNRFMVSEFAELRCFGEGKITGSLDAGKRGLITCQRFGHPANCFGKQRSGPFQNSSRDRRSRLVADSLDEWNGHSGDGVSTIIEYWTGDVDYAIDFVAFSFLVSLALDLGQMCGQVAWHLRVVLPAPNLQRPRSNFRSLMRKNYVPSCGVHKIDERASLNIKTGTDGRIDLRNNHDVAAIEYAKVAGLVKFMRSLLHDREGFGNHPLGWRIFVRQLKKPQCQTEAFPIPRLRDVTALFEAQQHPKDFGYSTIQATGDLAFRESRGVVGKEF
jgi:hypothetical protein